MIPMNRDENTLLGEFASLNPTAAGESHWFIALWTDTNGPTLTDWHPPSVT